MWSAVAPRGCSLLGVAAALGCQPGVVTTDQAVPAAPTIALMSDTLRVREAVGDLFRRHGVGGSAMQEVVSLLRLDPRRTPAGWNVEFGHLPGDTVASRITVRTRRDEEARLTRSGDNWSIERGPIAWTSRAVRVTGTVTRSLYDAVIDAVADTTLTENERTRLAWDIADVFAWEVDFTRDLQPGDRFSVLVKVETSERGEMDVGEVLASEISVGRRRFEAYRFEPTGHRVQYFDERGMSLRRAFLRAPVEFRRISSRFSGRRFHPILKIRRPHVGIDYAASVGTPVRSAGEGVLLTAAWSGNYGRLVEVRHRNNIVTRYAHLSAFGRGMIPGARILQGDVIGYVGASGLATAPHVHYEFRQDGVARDPSRVDLGDGDPVPAASVAAYHSERDRLRTLLRGSVANPPNVSGAAR